MVSEKMARERETAMTESKMMLLGGTTATRAVRGMTGIRSAETQ
jgi:hypothetical protein